MVIMRTVYIAAIIFGLATVNSEKTDDRKVFGLVFTVLMSLAVILEVSL